jgi:hypothetical protein
MPTDAARVTCARIQAERYIDLFDFFGVAIPVHRPPRLADRILEYFKSNKIIKNPLLLSSASKANVHNFHEHFNPALPFPSTKENANNVIDFPPSERFDYLTYGVYDTFRGNPLLKKAGLKFERHGYYVLGQLVQLTEDRVRAFSFLDSAILCQISEHIRPLGLRFGMYLPTWNRRFKYLPNLPNRRISAQ